MTDVSSGRNYRACLRCLMYSPCLLTKACCRRNVTILVFVLLVSLVFLVQLNVSSFNKYSVLYIVTEGKGCGHWSSFGFYRTIQIFGSRPYFGNDCSHSYSLNEHYYSDTISDPDTVSYPYTVPKISTRAASSTFLSNSDKRIVITGIAKVTDSPSDTMSQVRPPMVPSDISSKSSSNFDKWIVITSIAKVTDSVRHLAKLQNWTIVVVGDRKSPQHWSHENCVFLDVQSQSKLQYGLYEYLPFNSYTRKNLGYLYAIEHGAKFIYDTDDDNKPLGSRLEFDLGETISGIRVESKVPDAKQAVYWNPYRHFGQADSWPRGFPLQEIQNKADNTRLRLYSELKTSAIQQGLVNQDPDVDAVYRLTAYSKSYPIWFDPHAPAVQLGPGIFTPFNSQNTLFHYRAFWALYLPVSVAFRVCDIWRGYWALRLLSEIDESLAFYPANAIQFRNAHNFFHDYMDEKDLYEKTHLLVGHLHSWKCRNSTFANCAIDLAQMMARNGYWSDKDVRAIETWFRDLVRLGYVFPTLQRNTGTNQKSKARVAYASVWRRRRYENLERFTTFCQLNPEGHRLDSVTFPPSWAKDLKSLALIIVFNQPWHGNIPVLQALYERWFATTIFCSTFSVNALHMSTYPFSYINLTTMTGPKMNKGALSYACLVKAMEMRMRVEGYLVMGDDVLLNFWTPFDIKRLYYGYEFTGWSNATLPSFVSPENHARARRVIKHIKNDSAFFSQLTEQGKRSLEHAKSYYTYVISDIYYMPKHLESDALFLATRFLRDQLYVELAVPLMFIALGWTSESGVALRGSYVWLGDREWGFGDRESVLSRFNSDHHFLHTFKFSLLPRTPLWRDMFCATYGKAWVEAAYQLS